MFNNLENGQVTAEAQAFFDAAVQELQNNPDAEVDWEFQYIFEINETAEFKNHPCVKSIKDDLKNSSEISEIIKKFEPEYPVLNLEWGMFTNPDFGNTGQTILNEDISIAFININTESFNHVSAIVIAATIAHELIHAELYRKLKEQIVTTKKQNHENHKTYIIKHKSFTINEYLLPNNSYGFVYWNLGISRKQ